MKKYTEIRPYRIQIAKSFLKLGMLLGIVVVVVDYVLGKNANFYGALLSIVITPMALYVSRVDTFRYAANIVAMLIPLGFATTNITLNSADPITFLWLPSVPVFLFVMSNLVYGLSLSLLMFIYILTSYLIQFSGEGANVVSAALFSQSMMVYLFVVSLLAMSDYKSVKNESSLHKELKYDYLTRIYNRRGILQELDRLIRYASRYHALLCVILLDIDNFKKLNDKYGHDVGDDVLKYFSNLLQLNIRDTDYIGRYGGEEFLLLVPGLPLDASKKFAEKLRVLIDSNVKMQDLVVTASFGVAQYHFDDSRETLLKRADKAMYRAKVHKNCVASE